MDAQKLTEAAENGVCLIWLYLDMPIKYLYSKHKLNGKKIQYPLIW